MNNENPENFSISKDTTLTFQPSETTLNDTTFTFFPLEHESQCPSNSKDINARIQKIQKQVYCLKKEKNVGGNEDRDLIKILKEKKREKIISQKEKLQSLDMIYKKRIQYLKGEVIDKKKKVNIRQAKSVGIHQNVVKLQKLKKQVRQQFQNAIQKQFKQVQTDKKKLKIKKSVSWNDKVQNFFDPHSIQRTRSVNYYISSIVAGYGKQDSIAFEHICKSIQHFKNLRECAESVALKHEKITNMKKKNIYEKMKTIIFDLDETLIHCNQYLNLPYDAQFFIKRSNSENQTIRISVRPYAVELIKKLSEHFEIIIFTASEARYANEVIKILDPQNKYIQHKFFRQHCTPLKNRVYLKNLDILDRNLSDVVIVDNSAYSYLLHPDNAIPILPYYEGKQDKELGDLQKYLVNLKNFRDVRVKNRKYFKLHRYRQFTQAKNLIKQLYL